MEEILRISGEMQRVGLTTEQEQARLAQLRLFTTLLGNKAQTIHSQISILERKIFFIYNRWILCVCRLYLMTQKKQKCQVFMANKESC
jgi:hypothetical protein